MQLPGEKFELKVLEEKMGDGIERLRVSLKQVVGRVGRVSPGTIISSSSSSRSKRQ